MNSASIRTFWLISAMALAILTSCSKETTSERMGGQVTGGGSTEKSTPKQVNDAIDIALKLASEPDVAQNIFVQFYNDQGFKSQNQAINHPLRLFPSFISKFGNYNKQYENQFSAALKKNKIIRKPKGDCPHPSYEETADASVSELTYNADVCYSIGNLQAIPPSDLLRQVLALTLHESTHMGGAAEPEAQAWQREFSDYFGTRIGDLVDDVTDPTLKKIAEARQYLVLAEQHYNINPIDEKIAADFGEMAGVLKSLPHYGDAIALTLKMNPPHPELIPRYSEAVSETIYHEKTYFDTKELTTWGKAIVADNHPPTLSEQVPALAVITNLQAIDKYKRALDFISNAFLAFSDPNYKPIALEDPNLAPMKVKVIPSSQFVPAQIEPAFREFQQ